MVSTNTIYHPKFEPPEQWLRSMLLFYDTVHSIVPDSAEYRMSPGIVDLNEKATDAFVPLAPTSEDLQYDWDGYKALGAVLRELPADEEARSRADFDREEGAPRLDFGRGVQVHHDKMGEMLVHDLVEYGLAQRREDSDWITVDRRVADLVLSMLADRMARNRPGGIYTCSDRETSFAVAAKSDLEHGGNWRPEATLASAILQVEIPEGLVALSTEDYLDLRKRYEDKREIFRLAMQELESLYLDESFQSPEDFQARLKAIVGDFGKEMDKLRQQRAMRRVQRWGPVALGAIVSLGAAAITAPLIGIGAAGVTIALDVLRTAQGDPVAGTNIAKTQSLLAELGKDIRWNRNWLGRVFA